MIAVFSLLVAIAASGMHVTSTDIRAGGTFPPALTAADCGGANATPALSWEGAPDRTKSFAIVLHDADAPVAGGFDHWIVYDVPVTVHGIARSSAFAPPAKMGVNTLGRRAYYGPCPPPGPVHHYTLTVFALDVAHLDGDPLDGAQLTSRMRGHVLGQASIEATAAHP
jgi:Raf kinase inhibitor-like YbhB/YbcL family protein